MRPSRTTATASRSVLRDNAWNKSGFDGSIVQQSSPSAKTKRVVDGISQLGELWVDLLFEALWPERVWLRVDILIVQDSPVSMSRMNVVRMRCPLTTCLRRTGSKRRSALCVKRPIEINSRRIPVQVCNHDTRQPPLKREGELLNSSTQSSVAQLHGLLSGTGVPHRRVSFNIHWI